jgi:hypothetical protein
MAEYLTYWKYKTARRNEGQLITHLSSDQYKKVGHGDRLWVVTFVKGTLFLVGSMEVDRPVSEAEARQHLGRKPWPAKYHLIGKKNGSTIAGYQNIMDIAEDLRFEGKIKKLPTYFSAQSLRSMRHLTQHSVALLAASLSEEAPRDDESTDNGQGFNVPPHIRREIEAYAMKEAEDYFKSMGYMVKNRSVRNPFDYEISKLNERYFVEVKGTQSLGVSVILTANEVKFARQNRKQMILFILHSLKVHDREGNVRITGGTPVVKHPWDIDSGVLHVTHFRYRPASIV